MAFPISVTSRLKFHYIFHTPALPHSRRLVRLGLPYSVIITYWNRIVETGPKRPPRFNLTCSRAGNLPFFNIYFSRHQASGTNIWSCKNDHRGPVWEDQSCTCANQTRCKMRNIFGVCTYHSSLLLMDTSLLLLNRFKCQISSLASVSVLKWLKREQRHFKYRLICSSKKLIMKCSIATQTHPSSQNTHCIFSKLHFTPPTLNWRTGVFAICLIRVKGTQIKPQ